MKAKFVFENINFQRGLDPITSMGIGKDWTPRELGILYRKLLDKLGKYKKNLRMKLGLIFLKDLMLPLDGEIWIRFLID